MKQIPNKYREDKKQFRGLSSLIQAQYDLIFPIFDILCREKLSYYTLKGSKRPFKCLKERANSSLYGSIAKLDFLLMYLKENPNQIYHANLFEMSQAKVSEWLSFLLPVLEESLEKMGFMPQIGNCFKLRLEAAVLDKIDLVLIDVMERSVPRCTDYQSQKNEYSGKKKAYNEKFSYYRPKREDFIYFSKF